MVITLEHFTNVINNIKDSRRADEEFNKALRLIYTDNYIASVAGYLENILVDTLQIVFEDKGDWLGYWLWECDFGSSITKDSVHIDGVPYRLKTIEDLYYFLINQPRVWED